MKKVKTFRFSKIDFIGMNWYDKVKKHIPIERIDITQEKIAMEIKFDDTSWKWNHAIVQGV